MKGQELKTLKMKDNEENVRAPRVLIDRDAMTQETFIKRSGYEAPDKSLLFALHHIYRKCNVMGIIKGLVPIAMWLPKYSIKNYLTGDLISGATVAVMHIPQGMAYGILAGLTPSVGLYMAFFPVLAYLIFGTSKHISIGTFAVISMMTLKVVETYSAPGTNTTLPVTEPSQPLYSPLEVATATAFMVGVIQLLMAVFFLGFIANVLNEPLINGFTTGAAVHVICAQLKDVFGISIIRRKGAFKLIYTVMDIFTVITATNLPTLIFSLCIIAFMVIMNEIAKPFLAKKSKFPLPVELIAVISGTLISKYGEVGTKYNVHLVGNIPTGIPEPQLPQLSLFSLIWLDAIVIALISYSVVISMSLMFAKKHSYQISPNQELIALGIANIVGGSFSCIPVTCSLSRSLIQEQTGGMTQIASAVSAALILILLLWIGPFFETLPRCVLAGIIIVALKPMFVQIKSVKRFAKEGKLELLSWVCTFVGVVIIDIDYGLVIGVFVSLLILYIKGLKPKYFIIGHIPETELYVPLKYHKNAVEIPNTKIFRYYGSINFSTQSSYKRRMYELLMIDTEKIKDASASDSIADGGSHVLLIPFKVLILDLQSVAHIDMAGCKMLSEVMSEMKEIDVRLFLVTPSGSAYDALVHARSLGEGPFDIFATNHDAVMYSKAWRLV